MDTLPAIVNQEQSAIYEKLLIRGDLAGLTEQQRLDYYASVCRSLGLNPLTKPFAYITLNNKLTLYALRDCADQLRRLHGISIYITGREQVGELYIVTARAKDRFGREDESTGVVHVGKMQGEALANALMKTETKAKRRVTLSIAGLGWLDETEVSDIPVSARAEGQPSEAHAEPTSVALVTHPSYDQLGSLWELAHSAGYDVIAYGDYIRGVMDLPNGKRITKKFLSETMTTEQYEVSWNFFAEEIKRQVAIDVPDFPPLRDPPVVRNDPATAQTTPTPGAIRPSEPSLMPALVNGYASRDALQILYDWANETGHEGLVVALLKLCPRDDDGLPLITPSQYASAIRAMRLVEEQTTTRENGGTPVTVQDETTSIDEDRTEEEPMPPF